MPESSSTATVVASLRGLVAQSEPGGRLPSSRQLVQRLGVSPVTVSRALAVLAAEGTIHTRPGAGTFVAPARPRMTEPRRDDAWQTIALGSHTVDDSGMRALVSDPVAGAIPLASGYPHSSLLPPRMLAAAMTRGARRPGAWERPPLAGLAPLRRWFADSLGAPVSADDVLITGGGQTALSIALRATSPAGSPLLVESPTYPGLLAAARAAGLVPVPVPVDAGGLRTDLLAEAFERTGARVMYCQPAFQNPTGAVMDVQRRAAVLAVACQAGAFVIEDDWARWLSYGTPATAPLIAGDTDGRVIHLSSLTKTAAASLRIGALVARGPVAERLRALQLVDALFVSGPLQETALDVVTSSGWTRHLASLSAALRVRSGALSAALSHHAPGLYVGDPPRGGFYIWAQLPQGCDDVDVAANASAAGVMVAAGRQFFAAEPPAAFLRLSFAGPADVAGIDEGVRRLASVVAAR